MTENKQPAASGERAPSEVRDSIEALLDTAGVRGQRKLITQLVETSLGLGADGTTRANLKLSSAALTEMRRAFEIFAGYDGVPKVTVFGSARTKHGDPLWDHAEGVARGLAERGWMVVTGAGPGIMEAAAHGAGPAHSLGVSIRLPFEEKPNDMVSHDGNHVAMKYFFTRKLMLVKESRGFVCLPGGFGTLDETFELLTLQQTGKMAPVPIVLLDRPGGTYWHGFERFVRAELTDYGMVSPTDLDRLLITDSVDEAVAEIQGFWSNYDSLRWVAEGGGADAHAQASSELRATSPHYDRLMLRVRRAPQDARLAQLNEEFAEMVLRGTIERAEPTPQEIADRDRLAFERVTLVPKPRAIGELYRLIRALNGN